MFRMTTPPHPGRIFGILRFAADFLGMGTPPVVVDVEFSVGRPFTTWHAGTAFAT
jgi:hypothetical protein